MSARPRAPLSPGARVGAFVVREEIGFGATSIVYEAEHRTVRHRVAVKVLRSLSDMESELRQRFEREMRLSTALTSLHVPHVYEVGELPSGLPYIVMERLNGASLGDWLAVHRTLPVAVVVEIGVQLCAALEALHALEVVHRDVKPENLLLHQAFSDGYVLKLVDFGICKPLVPDGPALTRKGTAVGTPEYMSPEQVQGIDVDLRSDVYSAGVVLYELLTGRPPFEGRDLDVLGRAILFGSPPRISALRDDVSALLEGIIMRAIARDRAGRHPSIGAFKRELERFADEQRLPRHPRVWELMPASGVPRPLLPPPPEGLVRRPHPTLITPRIPIRRGWIAGMSAAALAMLVGAVLSVGYYVYEPARADARPASVEPEAPQHGAPVEEPPPDDDDEPADADAMSEPTAPSAPAASEPVAPARSAVADLRAPTDARDPPPATRRARSRPRARRAPPTPPSTTVAFAPTEDPPDASVPSTLSAADLFEPIADTASTLEPAPIGRRPPRIAGANPPARPSSPVPASPYGPAVPENPF